MWTRIKNYFPNAITEEEFKNWSADMHLKFLKEKFKDTPILT